MLTPPPNVGRRVRFSRQISPKLIHKVFTGTAFVALGLVGCGG